MYHHPTTSTSSLYLEGLAVSVGYGDFLETTLQRNLDHFDNFVVVTSYDDASTQAVCAAGVTCVQTDHHRDDGAAFNKGLLMTFGLRIFGIAAGSAPGCRHRHARPRTAGCSARAGSMWIASTVRTGWRSSAGRLAAAANEPAFPAAVSL